MLAVFVYCGAIFASLLVVGYARAMAGRNGKVTKNGMLNTSCAGLTVVGSNLSVPIRAQPATIKQQWRSPVLSSSGASGGSSAILALISALRGAAAAGLALLYALQSQKDTIISERN